MAFDVGKAVASGLVVGVVCGSFWYGFNFISKKIEAWKKARWDEKNKHLDPVEFVQRSLARDRRRSSTSLWIMGGAFLVLVIGLWLIAVLTKS